MAELSGHLHSDVCKLGLLYRHVCLHLRKYAQWSTEYGHRHEISILCTCTIFYITYYIALKRTPTEYVGHATNPFS